MPNLSTRTSIVPADNTADASENHLNREEIVTAKRFVALADDDRIVFDQELSYIEEETGRHRRKGAAHED